MIMSEIQIFQLIVLIVQFVFVAIGLAGYRASKKK